MRMVARMTRKSIAVLPGDGIGRDVMETAMKTLDAVGFRADYEYGDIGWEFWRTEGTPLPVRTIELLSKPKEEAEGDLLPGFQNKGLEYFSPIVKVRQEFNLHTNLRPCKAFPGNPLNYRDAIDIKTYAGMAR